jgi:ADP-ribose pyrophosphatase
MAPRDDQHSIREHQVLEEALCYDGFFKIKSFTLRHTLFEGGWSREIRRELFMRDDAVGVLPYDPERDEVLMIEQFRVGLLPRKPQPWVLELVAGIIEPGESVQDVAERESIEETGCPIDAVLPVFEYYSSPGGSSEYFYLLLGRVKTDGAGGIHGLASEGEDIKVHVFPLAEALRMMQAGEIVNAHTLIALQWLQLNKQSVLEQWR